MLLTIGNCLAVERAEKLVISQSLDSIEFQTFIAGFRGDGSLDESIRRVSKHRSSLLLCIAKNEKELASITATVGKEALEELVDKEDRSTEENRLAGVVAEINKEVQDCKLLLEKSEALLAKLTEHQLELNKEKLARKTEHIGRSFIQGLPELPKFLKTTLVKQSSLPAINMKPASAFIAVAGSLLLLLLGFIIRRQTVMQEIDSTTSFSSQITAAVSYMARRSAPLLMPVIFAVGYMYFVVGYEFSHSNLNRLLVFGIGFIFVQIILRAGIKRYTRFLLDTRKIEFPGPALYIRLVIASCLLGAWVLFVELTGNEETASAAESLFQTLLSISILISLIELARFLTRIPSMPTIASIGRWVSTGAFVFALLLECVGYHNIARFIWGGIVFSAVSLTLFYTIEKLLRDFYDGLEAGQRPWQRSFRKMLSVGEDDAVPGLIWIRLLSITVLWIALSVGVLKSWGTPNSGIASLFDYARNGFKVGDTVLTPVNILIGAFVFAVLVMVFGWFKDGLDKKYLSKSKMDSGAREAMVTITGYVGFVIAALAGLSIAGVGFGNLAIIAGALSLGIGFGLQNIVNNFVSGIILLFERPIKTGDWIITGSTEGYVKKIRVRSTEVQTFDRSDVIVPNSELISTQVTNWTLRDKYGRFIVPVGVAYGSDTALVKKLLLEVANEVPQIIKNRPAFPIKVLFMGFGDSTLNFELRGFIFDVSSIIDVRSDLHFAIDAAFRENNIEIAFPQRDIHIRSGGMLGSDPIVED